MASLIILPGLAHCTLPGSFLLLTFFDREFGIPRSGRRAFLFFKFG